MKMYRVIYRDGSYGGWTTNKERAYETCKYFNGLEVEEEFFPLP